MTMKFRHHKNPWWASYTSSDIFFRVTYDPDDAAEIDRRDQDVRVWALNPDFDWWPVLVQGMPAYSEPVDSIIFRRRDTRSTP